MSAESVAGSAYRPLGGALVLFAARDSELLLAGPSGTGKSRACLEKLHFMALRYPGFRALVVRKTRESLSHSGLVTYERCVLARTPGAARRYARGDEYRYSNGSLVVAGGMDRVSKIMSSEYDAIYVQEATELSLDEWEHITTRLRGSAAPFNQILACCNPAGPNHWLRLRAQASRLQLLESRHEDNPLLCDPATGAYTAFGQSYLAKLDALTGVRYQRLRKGLWVAAEGMVYEEFAAALYLRDAGAVFGPARRPPAAWRRFWAIDFGYTHPFCWQAWAQDPETKTLYRYAELYHTHLLVEEAAQRILDWMRHTGEEFPAAIVCDHDAEGRATLKAKLGVPTVSAKKSVALGIQAVKQRLARAGGSDGLVLVRDCGIASDRELVEAKQPTCTEEELELYVWREGIKDSEPLKEHDHGLDALRYLVMHVDRSSAWGPEEIAAIGRRWRGEQSGSAETDLQHERRLRRERAEEAALQAEASTAPAEEPTPEQHAEERRRQYLAEVEEINCQALLKAQRGFVHARDWG